MRDLYLIFGFVFLILTMLGMMWRSQGKKIDQGNGYLHARLQALSSGKPREVTVTRLGRSGLPRMFAGAQVGMKFYIYFYELHYTDAAGSSGVVISPVPHHAMASIAPGKTIIVKDAAGVPSNSVVDFEAMGFVVDHVWAL
jgi:hypothetical protein